MIEKPNSYGEVSPRYFFWLDLLRGLAAISVLIWHYQHFYDVTQGHLTDRAVQPFYSVLWPLYEYGGNAVQLFWVISGFIFSAVYVPAQVKGKEFFANRFARLYPLHLVTLFSMVVLQAISARVIGSEIIYTQNNLKNFVQHLLFVSGWGNGVVSFNSPIWSVSVEIIIYFLFFVLLSNIRKWKLFTVCVSVIMAVPILTFFPVSFEGYKHMSLFSIWCCGVYFFLGTAVYFLWQKTRAHPKKVLLFGLAAIVGASFMGKTAFDFDRFSLNLLILFPAAILVVAIVEPYATWIPQKIRFIGDSTYGIYLWHVPIQIVFLNWIYFAGADQSIIVTKWFFLTYLFAVLAWAFISYKVVEAPSRKMIRRWLY
jgi:peptidoglycan/LPS O-acetylase OafA/YrhL